MAGCADVADCRAQAQAAAARGDYEAFHDFAWRAVQKGRRNDPELMYLVARAQALSGRPDDALVMLGRLADLGVPIDAATSPDFASVRQLKAWPELEAKLSGTPVAAAPADPAPAASSPSPGLRARLAPAAPASARASDATDVLSFEGSSLEPIAL